jgi:hypothetical protein
VGTKFFDSKKELATSQSKSIVRTFRGAANFWLEVEIGISVLTPGAPARSTSDSRRLQRQAQRRIGRDAALTENDFVQMRRYKREPRSRSARLRLSTDRQALRFAG